MRVLDEAARERGIRKRLAPEFNAQLTAGNVKAARFPAKVRQELHVDLADGHAVRALALCKQRAVLGDEAQTGIAVVGRALAPAGRGQQQRAAQTLRESQDLTFPLVVRVNGLRKGGHLHDERRALQRVGAGGGERFVEIGAQLDGDGELAESGVGEERIRADRGFIRTDRGEIAFAFIFREGAVLHALTGDEAQQLAVADHGRDAQKLRAKSKGQTDEKEHVLSLARFDHALERAQRAV